MTAAINWGSIYSLDIRDQRLYTDNTENVVEDLLDQARERVGQKCMSDQWRSCFQSLLFGKQKGS